MGDNNNNTSYWNERWAVVKPELETLGKTYYFSDYGRIRSVDKITKKEKFLSGCQLPQGFILVNIFLKDRSRKRFYIHKLIAEEWIPKDHDGQKFAVHIDRNMENNFYQNLKWMSQKEMTSFMTEQGVFDPQKRKRNPNYKLNPARVQLIRKRLRESNNRKKMIAKEFDISIEHLKKIERREMWGWVEELK
jgi:hypothetical protein